MSYIGEPAGSGAASSADNSTDAQRSAVDISALSDESKEILKKDFNAEDLNTETLEKILKAERSHKTASAKAGDELARLKNGMKDGPTTPTASDAAEDNKSQDEATGEKPVAPVKVEVPGMDDFKLKQLTNMLTTEFPAAFKDAERSSAFFEEAKLRGAFNEQGFDFNAISELAKRENDRYKEVDELRARVEKAEAPAAPVGYEPTSGGPRVEIPKEVTTADEANSLILASMQGQQIDPELLHKAQETIANPEVRKTFRAEM
jgi:hypothetical protein